VAEVPAVTFGARLRQLRANAGLTQEDLAEKAGVAARSISDLEREISRKPQKDTFRRLADALGLTGRARAEFEAVARGRGLVGAVRTLPRDISTFTGRENELRQLMEPAVASGGVVGIHAIGGMAGVGKTAFAVHAAHRLTPRFPDGQIFLPLYGHTPGQLPVDPADALASLLEAAGAAPQQMPPDLAGRQRLWRNHMAGQKLLLVLDDALDSEQVRPLLPDADQSLVLVTSRRHLTALEDAAVISLDTLTPSEAAALLIRIAARPGLETDDGAVGEIGQLCGYLPLAIGIMAAQLRHHPAWTPDLVASRLRAARDRLKLMVAEDLSVAVAFDLSYANLAEGQQRLFRRLGLHPGDDIDGYAAAALGDSDLADARQDLEGLYENYLLTEPVPGRYRFHDLIRERARALGDTDPPDDRDAALGRLLNYYLHTARLADEHLDGRAPRGIPSPVGAVPRHVPDLLERQDAIMWMEAERLNLQAATEYADQNARLGYAIAIPAAMHGFLRAQGHWDQALSLHQTAQEAARRSGDRLSEADALTELGTIQRMAGDYQAADRSLTLSLERYHDLGDRRGEASALKDLGAVQALTGEYRLATDSLTRCVDLFRSLGDRPGQAGALNYLGSVQRLRCDYEASAASQTQAIELYRGMRDEFGEARVLNDLGAVQRLKGDYAAATVSQARALDLFRKVGYRLGQASALDDLGVIQTLTNDYPAALLSLSEALDLFSDLEHQQGKASALNDLGAVQALTDNCAAAAANFDQALEIYTDLGHLLGEAEVLNNMGEMALASAALQDADSRHRKALAIARGIPAPAEEARALEGIGRCQVRNGQATGGAASLRRAMEIYQQINSPSAERVAKFLRDQDL
jgi:tetratricopeptide (TPR) repeat protein